MAEQADESKGDSLIEKIEKLNHDSLSSPDSDMEKPQSQRRRIHHWSRTGSQNWSLNLSGIAGQSEKIAPTLIVQPARTIRQVKSEEDKSFGGPSNSLADLPKLKLAKMFDRSIAQSHHIIQRSEL